ncbi:hypothetical protein ABZX90_04795 [Streptomyces sp. NPDC002935]|uniref:hypothetical protein n=1 Tax=Streptomyces sp. NPDC002935 TaxID=3154545 RepID=UPI0033A892E2
MTAVVAIFVLHHFPEYLGTVERLVDHIVPAGALFELSGSAPVSPPDKNVDARGPKCLLAPEDRSSRYWSTQSGFLQTLGERLAPPTTFGCVAEQRY